MNFVEAEKVFPWVKEGKGNIVYEAIDRHVEGGAGDTVALYYSDGEQEQSLTFAEIQRKSCQFARGLLQLGIRQGDRVFLFMPRSPELYIALIGIIRMGAIAGPLFEAFMESAVRDRLLDSGARAIVTTPALLPRIPQSDLPELAHVIVAGAKEELAAPLHAFEQVMKQPDDPFIQEVSGEDGLYLHYTSGSTGKPKGVLHAHAGLLHQYVSGAVVYDFRPGDIYWCTADPGWITGTSAGIFAPWLHGVSIVVRGGRFRAEDWYATLETYGVTVWFSAPTAFRMLMAAGDEVPKRFDFSKLRHVLSAGEPLNPEVIRWGEQVLQRRIHDNWWMTETGSTICANRPDIPIRLGSMGKPLPGIHLAIVDSKGNELPPNTMGDLAILPPWPAMMRAIWGNEEKYRSYFRNGWYISGDSAYRDEDGYFWFQGRIDDVINTSGERVGPFEVESKLVEHPAVAEAGVIGIPDPLRGEIIKAFVTLRQGYSPSDELAAQIKLFVKEKLAAHAAPREIEFRSGLPKTRSGKIMRRVLKAWELGLPTGDLSTLEE
ncbi:acetate--CoA ligase [Brevibacillus fluminis]|uniref:acetate--CoA ligase n=1 Tax=Brevibacillus fluminis TaxID=511487 RepID=UPI003F8B257C